MQCFDDLVDVNGSGLIYDDDEHINTSLTSTTPDEVPSFVYEITSERNIRILTATSNRSEVILIINAFRSRKADGFYSLYSEVFRVFPAVSAKLNAEP